MHETGTGQQVAQLHERLMMMMICEKISLAATYGREMKTGSVGTSASKVTDSSLGDPALPRAPSVPGGEFCEFQ